MASLQEYLGSARLSENCKLDLINHVNQLNLQSLLLPKRNLTMFDNNLPASVLATTVSTQQKAVPGLDNTAKQRFLHLKNEQQEVFDTCMKTLSNNTYFKKCSTSYFGQRNCSDPFRETRSREQLSRKDEDFVYRYAEAMTHSKIQRNLKADDATVAAVEAYREAFRRLTNRDPTEKEMEEVNRLNFAFDEHGRIGVVQKPHSCYEHSHISCCNRRVPKCDNQLYSPEKHVMRAARDRFPGPIPIWSSTKNTYTMVAGDMHQSGHYKPHCSSKKSALRTIVGSK
ncbi:unnamed protein product [Phytomonas sp. EM1]|nr:unnamed protein product [Phytomonas sp. EM1]|eukprot:CCW62468.1 unnamed protein product [Phytomonas sp. isolate EM1]